MKPRTFIGLVFIVALAMNAKAQKSTQDQRVMAFQTVMAMHDTTYKNLIKDGKYKEAIAPLTKLWCRREAKGKNVICPFAILLGVFDNNPLAIQCYESVEFVVTGTDAYQIDGEEWTGKEMSQKVAIHP